MRHYRLVVVGGGTAGCAVASHFSRVLRSAAVGAGVNHRSIAVIEPNNKHYYQPGFTLVAGGLLNANSVVRNAGDVIPRSVDWLQTNADKFFPKKNIVQLKDGEQLSYDFMVLATGLELRFDLIKGISAGTLTNDPFITSMYTPEGAVKTRRMIQEFKGRGKALFTFPNAPIKCSGAPQKILYLADEHFKKAGVIRSTDKDASVHYLTSLGAIYGVPKYANSLTEIIHERGIKLHTRRSLREVDANARVAIFDELGEELPTPKPTGNIEPIQYSFLHIGPPCSPQKLFRDTAALKREGDAECTGLTDASGWVAVHPKTLQNPTYPNIFAIGDCANTPSPKTAAAISKFH